MTTEDKKYFFPVDVSRIDNTTWVYWDFGGQLPLGYEWSLDSSDYDTRDDRSECFVYDLGIKAPGSEVKEYGFTFRQWFSRWSKWNWNDVVLSPGAYVNLPHDVVDVVMHTLHKIPAIRLPTFQSPLEEKFWYAWRSAHGWLVPLQYQYEIDGGKYRVDFAYPGIKVAIELDGHQWHSSKEQFTKDRARQRELELQGWRFVRFSGQEIVKDPAACYEQALTFIYSMLTSKAEPGQE